MSKYSTLGYSITIRDGSVCYSFANGDACKFGGVDASKDASDTNVAVVQVHDAQTGELVDGPVIRSKDDANYTALKNAVTSLPDGDNEWNKLGVDAILSSGASANASNTPSIADSDAAKSSVVEPEDQRASAPQHSDEQSTGPQGSVEGQLGEAGTRATVDTRAGDTSEGSPILPDSTRTIQSYETGAAAAAASVTPEHLNRFQRAIKAIKKEMGEGYHWATDELIALEHELFGH